MNGATVHVYGVFCDSKCRYVGQSVNPSARFRSHRRRISAPSSLRIFRTVDVPSARRIESQIMQALRRRGEADLNVQVGLDADLRTRTTVELKRSFEELAKQRNLPVSCLYREAFESYLTSNGRKP